MEFKQALIVRKDLGMGRGKISAQCAHASLEAFLKAEKTHSGWAEKWLQGGQAKIVLRVESRRELFALYNKARGLPRALVRDAGKTQVRKGTATCVAIGPAPEKEIDRISGTLSLL